MENYIFSNGQKAALTDDQVAEIRKSFGIQSMKLSELKPGEVFRIGGAEMIVLEQSGDTTAAICKELVDDSVAFGGSNNYDGSKVDKVCSDWGKNLAAEIGEDNLAEHTVDLISNDGLKDYGTVKRKASLLTAALYRCYVEVLDQHKVGEWWWLATPFSTKRHGYERTVLCVAPSGYIDGGGCNDDCGVRPFCILKSHIFVSK